MKNKSSFPSHKKIMSYKNSLWPILFKFAIEDTKTLICKQNDMFKMNRKEFFKNLAVTY